MQLGIYIAHTSVNLEYSISQDLNLANCLPRVCALGDMEKVWPVVIAPYTDREVIILALFPVG